MSDPVAAEQAAVTEDAESREAASTSGVVVDFPDMPAISKEDVRGEVAATKEDIHPDRELVAPKVQEWLKTQKKTAEPSAVEQRLAAIEAALTPPEEGDQPTEIQALTNRVASLQTALAEREAEAATAAEQEREAASSLALQEAVVANLQAQPDKYPGLLVLKQEANVYTTLVEQLNDGETVSEDDVASKAETNLKNLYETLHAVYGTATTLSKEHVQSKAPKTTTLTQSFPSGEEVQSTEQLIKELGQAGAAAKVWERTMNR